jgi:hypothetical protein
LSDTYYPGWKAFVDGKRTKIYRANYTFRALPLSAGTHRVEFVYDPLSFKLGALFTILGIIGLYFREREKRYPLDPPFHELLLFVGFEGLKVIFYLNNGYRKNDT